MRPMYPMSGGDGLALQAPAPHRGGGGERRGFTDDRFRRRLHGRADHLCGLRRRRVGGDRIFAALSRPIPRRRPRSAGAAAGELRAVSAGEQPIRRNIVVQRWGTPQGTVGSVNEPRERAENGVCFNEKWLYRVPGRGTQPGYERIVYWLRYDFV